jgi:hypothetical protein
MKNTLDWGKYQLPAQQLGIDNRPFTTDNHSNDFHYP